MKLDVTFQQTDMSFDAQFDNVVQIGAEGTGNPSVIFFPSVSETGVLSWTNNGGLQNPKPVDIVSAVVSALPIYGGELAE